MEVGATSNPGSPMLLMYKNRLQEFTQKSAIPLPVYQTVNEGSQHEPRFRSSVVVDGTIFTSPHTFLQRKAAEQDVARLALETISRKIKFEGVPLIQEDTTFCKSILHEYSMKMNLEKPTYTTSKAEGRLPMFISHSVFNGHTYMGSPAKNKKEAEQMAARAVIECILANSDSGTLMCEIIKSKGKLFAALNKGNCTGIICDRNVALRSDTENYSINSIKKGKEVEATVATAKMPGSQYAQDEQVTKAAEVQLFLSMVEKPKGEHPCEVNPGTIGSGNSQTSPEAGLAAKAADNELNSIDASHLEQSNQVNNGMKLMGPSEDAGDSPGMVLSNSGKKRADKEQENENELKKARMDEQQPSTVSAAIPCESSVAQPAIPCESSAAPAAIPCESSLQNA